MIKPPSNIETWDDWPTDIIPLLKSWNEMGGRLRWEYHLSFTCVSCEEFCLGNRYADAVLDGKTLCDDCLIERARWYLND